MSEPFDYDPADFGADGLHTVENWRDSGYTHYTAWKHGGGQISWNEIQEAGMPREVVDMHIYPLDAGD
jgi:hypothetical protein